MIAHGTVGRTPISAAGRAPARGVARRVAAIGWIPLLLLGCFFLFAAIADLAADLHAGIPSDHATTFAQVAGTTWQGASQAAPGLARYITLLECAYAVHELVFGLLFLVIVAIPFHQGQRWAWWACWAPMLANVTYSLTFGRHDPTILARSLVADIALPVLLVLHVPAFFRHAANVRAAGVE